MVAAPADTLGVAATYTVLGIEHIPAALLFFSFGVEIGHLIFIAGVLLARAALSRVKLQIPKWAPLLVPYAIGSVAMFWVIERVAAYRGWCPDLDRHLARGRGTCAGALPGHLPHANGRPLWAPVTRSWYSMIGLAIENLRPGRA